MKVSVIVRTRNRARLLAEALGSVRAQTFADRETVVVDDASTDGTPALLAGLAGPRLRIVRHDRNLGPVEAANTGLAHARGEYAAFLDDDDLWLPRKLERQVAVLDAAPPEVAWAYAWCELVDGATGRVLRTVRKTMAGDIRERILALDAPGPPSTWLVRIEALRGIGGFRIPPGTDSPRSSDVDVIRRLALAGHRIAPVPEVLVRKRVHAGQMTAETRANLDARAAFHRAHLAAFAAELAAHPRARASVELRLAWIELRRGGNGAAAALALSACTRSPRTVAGLLVEKRWFLPQLARLLLRGPPEG